MRGLNALCLALGMAAVCSVARAEFRPLDDATLSNMTGQSGITVELQTELSMGKLYYQDEGYLSVNNLHLTGMNGGPLDNVRVKFDLAGQNEILPYGFSDLAYLGSQGYLSSTDPDVAAAMQQTAVTDSGGNVLGYGKQYNSGDLVIRIDPTNIGDPTQVNDYLNAIDFGLTIDSVKVSSQAQGAFTNAGTNLFSNINIKGYLGPTDIIVHNNGNGKSATLPDGTLLGDSNVEFDTHFKITDMSLNWDHSDVLLIFNLANVGIEGMTIDNSRGNDTAGSFGFASASMKLASATTTSGQNALAIYDANFRADISMPIFKVGGVSIGSVNFTDFVVDNTSLVVYGH